VRELDGEIVFHEPPDDADPSRYGVEVRQGDTELAFGRLVGSEVHGGVGDVEGAVFNDDSVSVTLVPRLGDWAIEMRGTVAADTMRGRWFQRASCCGAYGTFMLVRQSRDAGGRGI